MVEDSPASMKTGLAVTVTFGVLVVGSVPVPPGPGLKQFGGVPSHPMEQPNGVISSIGVHAGNVPVVPAGQLSSPVVMITPGPTPTPGSIIGGSSIPFPSSSFPPVTPLYLLVVNCSV